VDRREFILKSGLITTALLSRSSCRSLQENSNYKLGYQLFSIRDAMALDPLATLQILKSVGYQDFEIYGYDAKENLIYGFTPTEFKQRLDDLGLTTTSGHYGFSDFLYSPGSDLTEFVDKCIGAAKILGSNYITWPWLDPKYRNLDGFKQMASRLNHIGEQVTQAGLGFAYHNHGFEFEDHNGNNGYDIILEETDSDLVKLQMDMYWVMHSSDYTPKQLVAKQPERFVMWHIKDMDKVTRDYTELGNGSIDYTTLLPDPKKSGLDYYYIEQGGNYAINSTESALESARYFKKYLKDLI